MSSLRDNLLPALERIRGIPGQLGLRRYTAIAVRTVIWDGDRVGKGNKLITDVALSVAFGTQMPHVKQVSQDDIVRSGGAYEDQVFNVGPITPAFANGGFATTDIDPAIGSSPTEIYVKLIGPGTATDGDWYEETGRDYSRPFRIMMRIKKTAARPFG